MCMSLKFGGLDILNMDIGTGTDPSPEIESGSSCD